MNKKKKIPTDMTVVVVNDFDYIQGGASKVAIQTANLLAEEGMDVYYFSGATINNKDLNDKVKKVCTNQGEALKDKNKLRGIINGIYNFKAKKEFKKLLKTLDREKTIIHVHGWTKSISSSIFSVAFKMKYKLVLTMHDYFTACPNGGYFNYKKNEICHLNPMSCNCCKCNCDSRNYMFKLYRILRQFVQNKIVGLNKKLTDVISISDFSEKILKKTLNINTKIHRVYNPVDLDSNPEKVDYRKNKYYLYVGRVSPEKGVDIFCKAISDLGLKGIVVGDGPDLEKLKKEYPSIEYVGWKNPSEVKKYMKNAKALVFPSRWYETMGLTVIEAQQYGIPVIVASNTAATDFVESEKNVFENSNIDNLKEKITNIDTIKLNKIELVNYTKNNYIKNLSDIYTKVGKI